MFVTGRKLQIKTMENAIRKIKQPAISLDGKVYIGNSYISILKNIKDSGINNGISGKQGFITSNGDFVDRKEAAKIALEAKQTKKLKYPPLLSFEDLVH